MTPTIADVQEYWNARPCNIRHSPAPVGTMRYFEEVEKRKYFVEPHIPRFADFGRWAGKKVLEVGCGIGTDTINFARAGAEVTAIDLSEKSLDVARQRADLFGVSRRIRFYQGNAEHLSEFLLKGETYDLVYSFGVIHHSPDPDAIVKQMTQVAHPGTRFRIMVYHTWSTKVAGIVWDEGPYPSVGDVVARYSEAQTGCPVTHTYSVDSATRLLESKGIRVLSVEVTHIFPWSIPDYVQYRYTRKLRWRYVPDPVFRAMERIWGWHILLDGVMPGVVP